MTTSQSTTIFALSSAPGVAGVSVIRVSGPGTGRVAERLGLGRLQPRYARRVRIADPVSGEALDEGLALSFPGPASYTGEDVLELHVHGGRAVVAAVLRALAGIDGCRLAEPGEFTRRAFHGGKLDLTQAEGLADLIAAETDGQRRQALRVASGALRKLYDGWRADLISAMALMEASLDFADEADVADGAVLEARGRVSSLAKQVDAHLNDNRRGEIQRNGLHVVIAGPPNAGKSSLLNALARRDVAIVSPEPGTTRDVIEARLDLGGYPVIVSDTAGLRDNPSGPVEREGIRRSLSRSGEADLVLWLFDAAEPAAPPKELLDQGVEIVAVANKIDAASAAQFACDAAISARTGEGLPALLHLIAGRARGRIGVDGDGPAITTARQRSLIAELASDLDAAAAGNADQPELLAEDLRRAAQALGRLTGRVDVEDILDRVFSSFCIGK